MPASLINSREIGVRLLIDVCMFIEHWQPGGRSAQPASRWSASFIQYAKLNSWSFRTDLYSHTAIDFNDPAGEEIILNNELDGARDFRQFPQSADRNVLDELVEHFLLDLRIHFGAIHDSVEETECSPRPGLGCVRVGPLFETAIIGQNGDLESDWDGCRLVNQGPKRPKGQDRESPPALAAQEPKQPHAPDHGVLSTDANPIDNDSDRPPRRQVAMGGDGQVTLGNSIMKADAIKIRRLDGRPGDGRFCRRRRPTPSPCWSGSRPSSRTFPANVPRAATELAKEWRTDRVLRRLEALMAVVDADHTLLVSGNGDVIQPTDGILGIGSGGNYAVAAARALVAHSELSAAEIVRTALEIAGNSHLYEHEHHGGGTGVRDLTPREIVAELDRHIVGQDDAKRAVAIAIRNRWRRQQLPDEMRREVAPKNILMIGPTGVGKTEIARRLAKLTGAPFIKVEATKYTEVGYYGRDVESMIRELVENAIGLVRERERSRVEEEARRRVDERLLDLLAPAPASFDVSARFARHARSATSEPARRCGRCWPPARWNSGGSRSPSSRRPCR